MAEKNYLDEVMGPGGVLVRAIPGFAAREGQLDLARAIDSAFRDGANLFAEAGTGSGKSFAYSVPVVFAAAGETAGETLGPGSKVCIATANIALQEQLVGKDLATLARTLPWPFRYALAKGRANYLCLARADDVGAELVMAGSAGVRAEYERIRVWNEETATGDLSELPFEVQPDLRRRLTVTAEECTGKSCDRYDDCHANRAYRALPDAHVVVTNYHMLLADLVVRRATGGEAGILPTFDLLVMDEAHKLADIARDFLGFRVTPGSVRWAGRLLAGGKGKKAFEPIDVDLKRRLDSESERFGNFLRNVRRGPDYSVRIRDVLPDGWAPVCDLLREASARYLEASAQRALPPSRKIEIIKAGLRAESLAEQIREGCERRKDGVIYFIEEDERGRVALVSKPVSVAEDLRAMLFESDAIRSVIATSATLRTGSSFAFVKGELGAGSARELVVESPFDHEAQALLVFPPGMPEPKGREYTEAVARTFSEVVRLADGKGVLGLFTSYRALAAAHEVVEREHGHRLRIMRQGEAPRTHLVREFKADVSSVLLGTDSFWAGVDVPGEALSVVVIDKLPFAPPDDPVLDAVQDANPRNWFRDYSIPRAVIQFRQGAGRLLRSVSDRGVIVCCDPRVLGKGYGRIFVRSLPEMRISKRLEDIGAFLSAGGSKGPGTLPGGVGSSRVAGARDGAFSGQCGGGAPFALEPLPANVVDAGLRAIVGGARRKR